MLYEHETTTGTEATGAGDATGAAESAATATKEAEAATAKAEAEKAGGAADEWANFDADRAKSTILNLREREKELEKQVKEGKKHAARIAELEAAQLTEQEQQAKKLADLEAEKLTWETERKENGLRLGVYGLAGKLQIADTDLALAALDRSRLEYDDEGNPKNLEQVVTDLLESKPILKGQGTSASTGGTDGAAGRHQPAPPNLTAEELEATKELGVDPARFDALKGVATLTDWKALQEREKAAAKT